MRNFRKLVAEELTVLYTVNIEILVTDSQPTLLEKYYTLIEQSPWYEIL